MSWVEYKGAICKFENDLLGYGHMSEGDNSNFKLQKCLSRLNIARTKELKEYYQLVTEAQGDECIEYTDIELLQNQIKIEERVKGIFTLLIKRVKNMSMALLHYILKLSLVIVKPWKFRC